MIMHDCRNFAMSGNKRQHGALSVRLAGRPSREQ